MIFFKLQLNYIKVQMKINTSKKCQKGTHSSWASFSLLPPVKWNDRSEADCTPEMPSNLWAPASGGEHGGLLGPSVKLFHSVIPAIYVSLSLSATFCWHTCDKFDLATPPLSMNTFFNQNNQISDVRQTSGLVRCSWFQSGSSIAAWSPGRHSWDSSGGWTGVGQKGHRRADYAGGGRIKQKALGSYGLASIHRPRLWMDPSRVFMAHKSTSSSCPCLDWSSLRLGDSHRYFQLAFDSICSLSGCEVIKCEL